MISSAATFELKSKVTPSRRLCAWLPARNEQRLDHATKLSLISFRQTGGCGLLQTETQWIRSTLRAFTKPIRRNAGASRLSRMLISQLRKTNSSPLVGPSGCGKSTLLKLIGALIRPSRGTLLYNGSPLDRPPRDVGMVFQEAVLLQWRTVLDNVLLPAEILGLDKTDRSRARNAPP